MRWLDVSSKKQELENAEDYQKEVASSDGVRKFMDISIDGQDDDAAEEDGLKLFFTISTSHVDRDGDIIDQGGWDLDEYKKNPVVLWAHDSTAPPVARANSTYLAPSTAKDADAEAIHLMSVAEFPSRDLYPFGNMVGRLYKNGFLHGASVGFLPVEYEISKDKDREGFAPIDFKKQRLLEWSAVPVPSNPEGLVQARSAGIDLSPMVTWAEKILDGEGSLVLPRHLLEEVRKNSSSKVFILDKKSGIQLDMFRAEESFSEKVEEQVKSFTKDAHEHFTHDHDKLEEEFGCKDFVQDKTVISYRSAHPDGSAKAPEDEAWDGPKYVAEADVGELYDMSTYYSGDGEDKGDYKLPHHKTDGTVVLRGVQAAMAALLGARGGVDVPSDERKGIYNHLAEHYRAFDKDPPEFRAAVIEEEKGHVTTEEPAEVDAEAQEEWPGDDDDQAVEKQPDLKPDVSGAEEAESQDEVEKNDDDLRRLAKATFERRVLSLTHELKDLVGQISRGVDR